MVSTRAAEPGRSGRAEPGGVLVLNAGSSSLKGAFYAGDGERPRWRGKIDGLHAQDAELVEEREGDARARQSLGEIGPGEALRIVAERIAPLLAEFGLEAVGHRIVHGGPHLVAPVVVDAEVLGRLRAMERYDPAHQAIELGYIDDVARRFPDVAQVACFDTAFHHDLPSAAQRLPVARSDAERGLRRFGFHGLSYTHALDELRRLEGDEVANGRLVLAHLGSGASLAAVQGGRSIDTTMGYTPTGGFPMSTRSGDVDPGVVLWLARQHALSTEEVFELLTRRSGLQAISGTTGNLRELLEREAGDPGAAEAVEVFCYHVRKAIGALTAALGGLDVLVFTGGIGEHQPSVRERICERLGFLGVELDRARNHDNAAIISPPGAAVRVRVIAADEERVVARAVREVLHAGIVRP